MDNPFIANYPISLSLCHSTPIYAVLSYVNTQALRFLDRLSLTLLIFPFNRFCGDKVSACLSGKGLILKSCQLLFSVCLWRNLVFTETMSCNTEGLINFFVFRLRQRKYLTVVLSLHHPASCFTSVSIHIAKSDVNRIAGIYYIRLDMAQLN